MSCICGYLHFTRDLQYESFYLSQYILQFIINYKGEKKFREVHKYYGDTLRNDEAREQSNLTPTQICNVFSYVNKFIELLRISNGYCEKNVRFEPLVLDNTIHTIMDNGII